MKKRGQKRRADLYFDFQLNKILAKSKRSNSRSEFLFNKKLLNSKRSQANIITVVLIILLVLASIVVVWNVVRPLIKRTSEGVSIEQLKVDLDIQSAYIDGDNQTAYISIKRGAGKGNLTALKFIFMDLGRRNYIYAYPLASGIPDELEVKVYKITALGVVAQNPDLGLFTFENIISVDVAFVVKTGYGEEITSDIKDVFGDDEKEDLRKDIDLVNKVNVEVYDLGSESNPGASCLDVLNGGGSIGDNVYWIDPDGVGGADKFQVYCDMTSDGGGWTMIASYYNGGFFNDCSGITDYGTSCSSACNEFNSTGNEHCNDDTEKAIQDSEAAKLRTKFIINNLFSDVNSYTSSDVVLQSYYLNSFTEMMFTNERDEYITYDLSGQVTTSMKGFYDSIKGQLQLEVRFSEKNTNLDPAFVNPCDTLEVAMNSADNDGGAVDYSKRIYKSWSPASAGPAWDGIGNGGCGYDDQVGKWSRKRLGGQLNTASQYIMWLVK